MTLFLCRVSMSKLFCSFSVSFNQSAINETLKKCLFKREGEENQEQGSEEKDLNEKRK